MSVGLLMTGLLYCQHGPDGFTLASGSASRMFLAAAFSNQFYAAYLPAVDHSWQNQSPATRMSWTNREASSSSTRFFPEAGTNEIRNRP